MVLRGCSGHKPQRPAAAAEMRIAMTIWRLPKALEETGKTRTPWYQDVARGLMTAPVKIGGARAAGWPSHEVEAVMAARIASASDEDIRCLVDRLHEARKSSAPAGLTA